MKAATAREVIVTISPDGEKVEVDAIGFVGGACKDFTKNIISALGTVQEEKKKPEFFREVHEGVHIGS